MTVFTRKHRHSRPKPYPRSSLQQDKPNHGKTQAEQLQKAKDIYEKGRDHARPAHSSAKDQGNESLRREEGAHLPPLQYHCGPRLAAAFRKLCQMERDLARRGVGTWILDRYGVSIFVHEPLPLDSIHYTFGAFIHQAFCGVRTTLTRLMEEILCMNPSGQFFKLRPNIHNDMAGPLKQAEILGHAQQPTEIEEEKTSLAQIKMPSHKGDVCLTTEQQEAASDLANKLKEQEAKIRNKIDQLKKKLRHQTVITKYFVHPDVEALESKLQETVQVKNKLYSMMTTEPNPRHKYRLPGARTLEAFDYPTEWKQEKNSKWLGSEAKSFYKDILQDGECSADRQKRRAKFRQKSKIHR